jgi:hypothetical protein
MKQVIFFCSLFSSINPSVIKNFLLQTDLPTDKKLPTQIHRQSIFVGDFVGKLITNGMIVQIPTENSFGKSKDCGSVCARVYNLYIFNISITFISFILFSIYLVFFCFKKKKQKKKKVIFEIKYFWDIISRIVIKRKLT